MNGHLQLSINLKDHQQIKDALKLLTSLLPSPKLSDYYDSEFYAVAPASKGDLVKLTTKKPELKDDKIIENLMRGAPKPRMLDNDKIIENLKRAKFSTTPEDEWKKIDAEQKKNRLKRRARTLKMKRNAHGQFVKQKK